MEFLSLGLSLGSDFFLLQISTVVPSLRAAKALWWKASGVLEAPPRGTNEAVM